MKLQNLLIQAILLVFLYNCTRHYDSGKGDIIIKGTNRISMTKNDIDSKDEDNKTLMPFILKSIDPFKTQKKHS